MQRRGHVYYFEGSAERDRELTARRDRCRRVDSPEGGHIALEGVDVQLSDDGRGFVFLTRLNISGPRSGGYFQCHLTDGQLVELMDVFEKYLQRPRPAAVVKVVLEQPRPRRVKRILSPADELTEGSSTHFTPEERAIHKRMLEGK